MGDPMAPATRLGQHACRLARMHECGVGIGGAATAVESGEVPAGLEWERKLHPAGHGRFARISCGGEQASTTRLAESCAAGHAVVVAMHAGEEQLVMAYSEQERL